METSQQSPGLPVLKRASPRQRLLGGITFIAVAGIFLLGWLMGHYHFTLWPFACGFKQKYGLPCPTCGMTTAAIAFSRGGVVDSFCTQPAAAFFCCLAAIMAIFGLLAGVFGVYFSFLERSLTEIKLRYVVAALGLVIAAGWAVTLARALAQRAFY